MLNLSIVNAPLKTNKTGLMNFVGKFEKNNKKKRCLPQLGIWKCQF